MQAGEENPGDVGADDDQCAVRQVDDVEDAPYQAETQRDGDIDATKQKTKDELLDELAAELSSAARIAFLARAPGRRRILRGAVRHVAGKDRVVRTVLDLLDDHRLVDIDPAAVEFDLTEERHDVEPGQCIANLARVEGPSVLDRLLKGEASRRGLGYVVVGILAGAELGLVGLDVIRDREVEGWLVLDLGGPL